MGNKAWGTYCEIQEITYVGGGMSEEGLWWEKATKVKNCKEARGLMTMILISNLINLFTLNHSY